MIEGWPEKILEAQAERTYRCAGHDYPRIAYGSEVRDWSAHMPTCPDCAVKRGQLHVPGCDVEQCPACGEQAISCACLEEEEEVGGYRLGP